MDGKQHTRTTAAALLDIKPPAAFTQLQMIKAEIPGVLSSTRGREETKFRFDKTRAQEAPRQSEVIGAALATSIAGLFAGSSYQTSMRTAFKFILDSARPRKTAEFLERKFFFRTRGGEVSLKENSGTLDDVIDAVLKSREVQIEYVRYGGKHEQLTIEPLSIAIHDHQLYVIGRSKTAPAYPYRFSRIKSIEETGRAFQYPSTASYNPDAVFNDSFGIFVSPEFKVEEVVLRLHERWRTYAESHSWHPSQRIDGGQQLILHLRVRVCFELEAWILGFAEDAEVLAPKSLREKIASRHRKAAELNENTR